MKSVDMTRLENVNLVRGPVPLAPSPENLTFSHMPVRTPVALSHTFSQARFSAPAARTASPSVWNRVDSTRGGSSTGHSGTSTPGQYEPVRSSTHASRSGIATGAFRSDITTGAIGAIGPGTVASGLRIPRFGLATAPSVGSASVPENA